VDVVPGDHRTVVGRRRPRCFKPRLPGRQRRRGGRVGSLDRHVRPPGRRRRPVPRALGIRCPHAHLIGRIGGKPGDALRRPRAGVVRVLPIASRFAVVDVVSGDRRTVVRRCRPRRLKPSLTGRQRRRRGRVRRLGNRLRHDHFGGSPRHDHRVRLGGLAVAGRHLRLDRICADSEVDLEAVRVTVGVGQRRVGAIEVVHPGAAVALGARDRDLVHAVGHTRGVGGRRRVEHRIERDVCSGAAIVPSQAEAGQRGVAGGHEGMSGDIDERHLVGRFPDTGVPDPGMPIVVHAPAVRELADFVRLRPEDLVKPVHLRGSGIEHHEVLGVALEDGVCRRLERTGRGVFPRRRVRIGGEDDRAAQGVQTAARVSLGRAAEYPHPHAGRTRDLPDENLDRGEDVPCFVVAGLESQCLGAQDLAGLEIADVEPLAEVLVQIAGQRIRRRPRRLPRHHHGVGPRCGAVLGRHPYIDRVRADFQIDLEAVRVGVGVGQQLVVLVEVVHRGAIFVARGRLDGDPVHLRGRACGVGGDRRIEVRGVGDNLAVPVPHSQGAQVRIGGLDDGIAIDLDQRNRAAGFPVIRIPVPGMPIRIQAPAVRHGVEGIRLRPPDFVVVARVRCR